MIPFELAEPRSLIRPRSLRSGAQRWHLVGSVLFFFAVPA